MKNLFYLPILLTALVFTSCDPDDDDHNHVEPVAVMAPDTYSFEREGITTVYYSGQTCRLEMADDIYFALNNPEAYSAQLIQEMFDSGTGFPVEYECGKNVGGKTAASSSASSTVKGQFDAMITELYEEEGVAENWTNTASVGIPGKITTSGLETYQVNAKGLEIDQAFIKGLIGAMCVDQIANNYLTASKLDGDGTTNDTNGLLAGQDTNMEHYWDEGFGYLYGRDSQTNPALGVGVLLNKYLKKVNDINGNEPGIGDVIYNAFKLGRAAIVEGEYGIRDEQAAIIKANLNKIIAYKAVDYLTGGASTIASGADREDTFHGLSEGYGFVLSLQFTDYFSNVEVNSMLDELMAGNGFWDVTADQLNVMANNISAVAGL